MPNGPTFITDRSHRGGASPEIPSDVALQTGPPPHGIYRRFTANDRGIIGNDVNTFPTEGSENFVPHRAIIRQSRHNVFLAGPTVDDTAHVAAFAVGDPW